MSAYDYEVLASCRYPVPSNGTPSREDDCRQPATYKVWWFRDDGEIAGEMFVCQDHFAHIHKVEASDA